MSTIFDEIETVGVIGSVISMANDLILFLKYIIFISFHIVGKLTFLTVILRSEDWKIQTVL